MLVTTFELNLSSANVKNSSRNNTYMTGRFDTAASLVKLVSLNHSGIVEKKGAMAATANDRLTPRKERSVSTAPPGASPISRAISLSSSCGSLSMVDPGRTLAGDLRKKEEENDLIKKSWSLLKCCCFDIESYNTADAKHKLG